MGRALWEKTRDEQPASPLAVRIVSYKNLASSPTVSQIDILVMLYAGLRGFDRKAGIYRDDNPANILLVAHTAPTADGQALRHELGRAGFCVNRDLSSSGLEVLHREYFNRWINTRSRAEEFIGIIDGFETIDEVSKQNILQCIFSYFKTFLEKQTEVIEAAIGREDYDAAVTAAEEAQNKLGNYDLTWNLFTRFERELLVEPSNVAELYQSIPKKSPHYNEAQQRAHVLLHAELAPAAGESEAEKVARLEQGFSHARASGDPLLSFHTFNELAGFPMQASSSAPENDLGLLFYAASKIREQQEQLRELKEYKAKAELGKAAEARLRSGFHQAPTPPSPKGPKSSRDA